MNCKNCGRRIGKRGSDGKIHKVWFHIEGYQRWLIRCWPGDSGKPYGLGAEPEEERSETKL